MGTGRWFNVVSWVKYGRDVDAVIHNVVSTSIIRRRNITEYSTSSRRCDLERLRRHCRQPNPTSISSRNDVVAGHLLKRFINKRMETKGNKNKCIKYYNKRIYVLIFFTLFLLRHRRWSAFKSEGGTLSPPTPGGNFLKCPLTFASLVTGGRRECTS